MPAPRMPLRNSPRTDPEIPKALAALRLLPPNLSSTTRFTYTRAASFSSGSNDFDRIPRRVSGGRCAIA